MVFVCGENVHMDRFFVTAGIHTHSCLLCCWLSFFFPLPTSPPPSAYIQIDTDGDGKITEREFVSWTQGGEVSDLVEQRVGAP